MQKHLLEIKSNTEIADKIFKLELLGNFDLNEFEPGKFIHIRCNTAFLRRPMSICDIQGSVMTVLYRSQGKGTAGLTQMQAGETLDVLAPLGQGFPVDKLEANQRVLLVGGGIGVPPLYYLGRQLKARGHHIISLLGFNSAKDVFYKKEFKELGETKISTIDGTDGHKGYVTDLLPDNYNWLYSCGPTAMLKTLQSKISSAQAYISLEERMGCGVGACLACVCKSNDPSDISYNRVCTEGPVFPIHAIKL